GFDALFILSPFSFEIDFNAGLDVSFEGHSLAGISVEGLLAGPTPWHVHGHAEFHILFFSVGATVDLTWGDSTPAGIPSTPVLPALEAALADNRNWSTALPDFASQAVSFAARPPGDTSLVLHPMGTLTVRETVVPLDQQITKFGSAAPSDGNQFSISSVTVNGTAETTTPASDYFARAQYMDLSDADKLTAPSYELFHAGVTIGSSDLRTGHDSPRTVVYEERYIDNYFDNSRFRRSALLSAAVQLALGRQGAGFRSAAMNTGVNKFV